MAKGNQAYAERDPHQTTPPHMQRSAPVISPAAARPPTRLSLAAAANWRQEKADKAVNQEEKQEQDQGTAPLKEKKGNPVVGRELDKNKPSDGASSGEETEDEPMELELGGGGGGGFEEDCGDEPKMDVDAKAASSGEEASSTVRRSSRIRNAPPVDCHGEFDWLYAAARKKGRSRVFVDSDSDCRLLRLMLELELYDPKVKNKAALWNELADAMKKHHGRFRSGRCALNRYRCLAMALRYPSHRLHRQLPTSLRALLEKYAAKLKASRATKSTAKKAASEEAAPKQAAKKNKARSAIASASARVASEESNLDVTPAEQVQQLPVSSDATSAMGAETIRQQGVMVAQWDQERREHRAEMLSMVEMLKAERQTTLEVIKSDRDSMLQAIERAGDRHHQQISALVDLVARSVVQQTPRRGRDEEEESKQ